MNIPKGFKRIYIDVMIDGRFVRQVPFTYSPLFSYDKNEVIAHVLNTCPSLKDKPFTVAFSSSRV